MMPVYNKDSRLSEPLFHDPSLIPVYNRFGIFLGVGDLSVREACEAHEVNLEFFLAVINTYLNKDYFPGNLVEEIHVDMLLDYLEKTDSYYADAQLPNIERHFNFLLQKSVGQSAAGSSLELLRKFFFEVKEEMTLMIRNDLEYWFPLFRNDLPEARVRIEKRINDPDSISVSLPFNNPTLEEKIQDLISFFVIHLKGDYDRNLLVAVVSAIYTLAKDVRQNNRIRDRILQPICIRRQ